MTESLDGPESGIRYHPDPRVRALCAALEAWLPRAIACERTRNAVAPMLLIEGVHTAYGVCLRVSAADCIRDAITNSFAMCGYVASPDDIERAIAAWYAASADPR